MTDRDTQSFGNRRLRCGVIFGMVASVVTLVLSVLSFYDTWWNENPCLIAKKP